MPLRVFKYVFSKFSTNGRRDGTPTQSPCFVLHKMKSSLPSQSMEEGQCGYGEKTLRFSMEAARYRENMPSATHTSGTSDGSTDMSKKKTNKKTTKPLPALLSTDTGPPQIDLCQAMHMSTCVVDLCLENWDCCLLESKLVKAIFC